MFLKNKWLKYKKFCGWCVIVSVCIYAVTQVSSILEMISQVYCCGLFLILSKFSKCVIYFVSNVTGITIENIQYWQLQVRFKYE